MRRILLVFGLVLLVAYGAWPYMTLRQLDQAVAAQDEAALDQLIDWARVGQGLEQDLEAMFDGSYNSNGDNGDPLDSLAENLLGIFADLMIDPVVNFYMTPRGIAYLLNTQIILEDPLEVFEDDFPSEDTWADHISFAFSRAPLHFLLKWNFPKSRTAQKMLGKPAA